MRRATVPKGGGLSSSASFEVAMALAYLGEHAGEVAPWELAHSARRAENAFVGVNCGIMDQFACVFGARGQALMLDCRTLEFQKVPFPPRHRARRRGHRRQARARATAAITSGRRSAPRRSR